MPKLSPKRHFPIYTPTSRIWGFLLLHTLHNDCYSYDWHGMSQHLEQEGTVSLLSPQVYNDFLCWCFFVFALSLPSPTYTLFPFWGQLYHNTNLGFSFLPTYKTIRSSYNHLLLYRSYRVKWLKSLVGFSRWWTNIHMFPNQQSRPLSQSSEQLGGKVWEMSSWLQKQKRVPWCDWKALVSTSRTGTSGGQVRRQGQNLRDTKNSGIKKKNTLEKYF